MATRIGTAKPSSIRAAPRSSRTKRRRRAARERCIVFSFRMLAAGGDVPRLVANRDAGLHVDEAVVADQRGDVAGEQRPVVLDLITHHVAGAADAFDAAVGVPGFVVVEIGERLALVIGAVAVGVGPWLGLPDILEAVI